MSLRFTGALAALLALASLAAPAQAHVVLEQREAAAGSYYKATFRVGHGCAGAATTQIKVTLPDGIGIAKPQPKPGWVFAAVKRPVSSATGAATGAGTGDHAHHEGHGPAERTAEATWTGGPLGDDQYDEFVLFMKLPDAPGTTLYFPVVQSCVTGVNAWVEIPAAGQSPRDLKAPAAALKLTPKP